MKDNRLLKITRDKRNIGQRRVGATIQSKNREATEERTAHRPTMKV